MDSLSPTPLLPTLHWLFESLSWAMMRKALQWLLVFQEVTDIMEKVPSILADYPLIQYSLPSWLWQYFESKFWNTEMPVWRTLAQSTVNVYFISSPVALLNSRVGGFSCTLGLLSWLTFMETGYNFDWQFKPLLEMSCIFPPWQLSTKWPGLSHSNTQIGTLLQNDCPPSTVNVHSRSSPTHRFSLCVFWYGLTLIVYAYCDISVIGP